MDSFEPVSELNYEVDYDAVTLFWNEPESEGISGFDVYKNGSFLLSTDQTSVSIVSDNSVSNYGVKVKYYEQCYSYQRKYHAAQILPKCGADHGCHPRYRHCGRCHHRPLGCQSDR